MTKTKYKKNGQALVEWCVFILPALALSFAAAGFAIEFFQKATVQTIAPLAARRALSRAQFVKPPGVNVELEHSQKQGRALVEWDQQNAAYEIRVPSKRAALLPWSFF